MCPRAKKIIKLFENHCRMGYLIETRQQEKANKMLFKNTTIKSLGSTLEGTFQANSSRTQTFTLENDVM